MELSHNADENFLYSQSVIKKKKESANAIKTVVEWFSSTNLCVELQTIPPNHHP